MDTLLYKCKKLCEPQRERMPLTRRKDAFCHASATDGSNGVAIDVVLPTFNGHCVAQAKQSQFGSTKKDTSNLS